MSVVHKDPYLATHLRICFNWLRDTDLSQVESHSMLRRGRAFRNEEGISRALNRITSIELNLAVIYIEILFLIILYFASQM